jgi:hypothetical protein
MVPAGVFVHYRNATIVTGTRGSRPQSSAVVMGRWRVVCPEASRMSSDDLDLDDRLGGDHRSSPRRPVVAAADPACNLLAGSLIETERICEGPNTSRSSLCAQCAVCSLVVPVRSQFSRLAVAMSVSRDRDWVGNPSARTMKKYTDQGILLERIGPVAGPRTRWRVLCARCYECGGRRPFSTPHKALAHVRTACWYSAAPEGVRCAPSACLPFCASWTAAPAGNVVLERLRAI